MTIVNKADSVPALMECISNIREDRHIQLSVWCEELYKEKLDTVKAQGIIVTAIFNRGRLLANI